MKPNASAPSLKSAVLRSSRGSDATAVINVVAVAITEPQFNTQGIRDHKTAWGHEPVLGELQAHTGTAFLGSTLMNKVIS